MSTLTELSISGIRAFDNHESQTLRFNTPLTLICGANGVGKTTIIECLRYATTGDLPPNSKGGAFIHDPKMSSKSMVKAQIRLKFRDAKNRPMQVARSMQLTVSKKNVYSMKTLDGYLIADVDQRGGSGASARPRGDTAMDVRSARHADLNVLVPQTLGIPPAILNYVMFCHQEDSQWPLAEASQVKKRFDEIFEATRYTKALDTLKIMRRDYSTTTKLDEAEVNHLQQDRLRVEEKWRQVRHYEQSQFDLEKECTNIRAEHAKLVAQHAKALEHRQFLQQLIYVTKDVQAQLDRTFQDVDILRADITEPDLDSVGEEELREMLHTIDEYESELATNLQNHRSNMSTLSEQIETSGLKLAGLTNEQGRLQEMIKAHEHRTAQRRELVVTHEDIEDWNEEWMDSKRREIDQLQVDLDRLEVENRQKEEKVGASASEYEAQRLQLKQQMASLRTHLQRGDEKLANLQSKLKDPQLSSTSSETESVLINRISELDAQLSKAMQKQTEFDQSKAVYDAAREVREAEVSADEARKLVQTAINASDALSRLNFLRDSQREIHAKRQSLNQKLEEFAEKNHIDFEADNVENRLRDSMNEKKTSLDALASSISRLKSDLELNETMSKQAQQKLTDLESRRTELYTQLEPVTSLNSPEAKLAFGKYEAEVRNAEEELIGATEQEEQLQFAHSFFNRALDLAENPESSICLLCEHHKTPQEASALVKKLKAKIMAFSVSPEEAQHETQQKRTKLATLRGFQGAVEQVRRLEAEIQDLKVEVSDTFTADKMTLESKLNLAQAEFDEKQRSYRNASDYLEPLLTKSDRLAEDMSSVAAKLQLENSLVLATSQHISPQEAQERQEQAEMTLKSARRRLEEANTTEREVQKEIYQLTNATKELRLQLNELQQKLAEKQRVYDEISENRNSQERLNIELDETRAKLPELDEMIAGIQTNLRSIKFESARAEHEIASKRNSSITLLKKVEELTVEIERFANRHGDDPLATLHEQISKLEQDLRHAKKESVKISSQIDDLVSKQSTSGTHRRNISDTLKVKRLIKKTKELEERLREAQTELAEAQKSSEQEDWEARINQLQSEIDTLDREVSAKAGEYKAIGQHIAAIRHELETTYENTQEKYQEAMSKLDTNKGVIEDLEKYVKVMDSAIMRYHSNKMAQINSLLDQMWRQTYTGTDIDTILIRSESDPGSSSARANYNYRVCMVKRDTELDMRGRCSAGQKVLASIIIRMVLAESFGPRSGLIVLDEPTTNLDTQNITTLAQSLNEIIGGRMAQKNFQLIVITHDEHFLSLMNPADFCEDYNLIKRDSKQLSRIERKPISSLGYEV